MKICNLLLVYHADEYRNLLVGTSTAGTDLGCAVTQRLRYLFYNLIRVLGNDGKLVGDLVLFKMQLHTKDEIKQ